MSAVWGGFLAMFGTTIVILGYGLTKGSFITVPTKTSIVVMLVAGAINGVGIILHSNIMTDPSVRKVIFQPSLAVGMVITSAVVAWLILREPINIKQVLWFLGAMVCIVMATIQK
ncbi:hypothetical protein KC865_01660 [Candidatus Kaiserbacteria bacterium]|nr:hypothetical protein [Candidatus Kaiserbacteria bacterium]USN92048.1 MAG: hypothetical protein H6782_04185 [Candidatus Nomurabacteria bacterium]